MGTEQGEALTGGGTVYDSEQLVREDLMAEGLHEVWRWLEQVGAEWGSVTPDTVDVYYPVEGGTRCTDQHGREHHGWLPIENRDQATAEEIQTSWEHYVDNAVVGYDDHLDRSGLPQPSQDELTRGFMVGHCEDEKHWDQYKYEEAKRYRDGGERNEDRYQLMLIHYAAAPPNPQPASLSVELYDAKKERVSLSERLVLADYQLPYEQYIEADKRAATRDAKQVSSGMELD